MLSWLRIEHANSPSIYPIQLKPSLLLWPNFTKWLSKINHISSTSTSNRSFDIGLRIIWSGFELPVLSLMIRIFHDHQTQLQQLRSLASYFVFDHPSAAQYLPSENSFCVYFISVLTKDLLEILFTTLTKSYWQYAAPIPPLSVIKVYLFKFLVSAIVEL